MIRAWMTGLIVLVALLVPREALAGSLTIDRNDGALSSSDVSALSAEAGRWPFAVHVLTGVYATRVDLRRAAHECVREPGAICIGVDPGHRAVEVRFGTGTGVPASEYEAVSAAGRSRFGAGDWRGGIEAIADRASSVAPAVAVYPYFGSGGKPSLPVPHSRAIVVADVASPPDSGGHFWVCRASTRAGAARASTRRPPSTPAGARATSGVGVGSIRVAGEATSEQERVG